MPAGTPTAGALPSGDAPAGIEAAAAPAPVTIVTATGGYDPADATVAVNKPNSGVGSGEGRGKSRGEDGYWKNGATRTETNTKEGNRRQVAVDLGLRNALGQQDMAKVAEEESEDTEYAYKLKKLPDDTKDTLRKADKGEADALEGEIALAEGGEAKEELKQEAQKLLKEVLHDGREGQDEQLERKKTNEVGDLEHTLRELKKPEPAAEPELVREPEKPPPPQAFLPNTFYFENTYLGGDAGYRESVRRLDAALGDANAPHRLARLPAQTFDAPEHDGLALTATVDRASIDEPGRVFLQVGIRGSERFGWRRPPLELVLVIDTASLSGNAAAVALVEALATRLGTQDRFAVVASGRETPVAELDGVRRHRMDLLPRLDRELPASGGDLGDALRAAGALLGKANDRRTTAPGTQVILVLTGDPVAASAYDGVASELGLQGIVTSVIGLGQANDDDDQACWNVAAAGHGNLHTAVDLSGIPAAVDAELELLSRVVARLIRLNVRLAKGVKVVRVLGSRPLGLDEVQVVKAREVETDKRLSNVLGIVADRGDDDDGIQTVIPVFYGGDAHVVVLELWADGPGPIADVGLKYKDLVNLDNATARTSVSIRSGTHGETANQLDLARNRVALERSEAFSDAAAALESGDVPLARSAMVRTGYASEFNTLFDRADRGELNTDVLGESMELAARRSAGGGG